MCCMISTGNSPILALFQDNWWNPTRTCNLRLTSPGRCQKLIRRRALWGHASQRNFWSGDMWQPTRPKFRFIVRGRFHQQFSNRYLANLRFPEGFFARFFTTNWCYTDIGVAMMDPSVAVTSSCFTWIHVRSCHSPSSGSTWPGAPSIKVPERRDLPSRFHLGVALRNWWHMSHKEFIHYESYYRSMNSRKYEPITREIFSKLWMTGQVLCQLSGDFFGQMTFMAKNASQGAGYVATCRHALVLVIRMRLQWLASTWPTTRPWKHLATDGCLKIWDTPSSQMIYWRCQEIEVQCLILFFADNLVPRRNCKLGVPK